MSFQTLKRIFLFAALTLAAQSLLAGHPSARIGPRAAYNEATRSGILFGGAGELDLGTAQTYYLDETWEWDGGRFIRRYPETSPSGRQAHAMVYDSKREQIVLFGGRNAQTELNDTWVYEHNEWHQVETADAPLGRVFAGAAYDSARDRILLYGGQRLSDDKKTILDLTDLWEFDGENWTRIFDNGPQIRKPIMAYDAKRNQVVMLGHNELFETSMFVYDAAEHAFKSVTPATLTCANEAGLTYAPDLEKVVLVGGVCTSSDPAKISPIVDDVWAWDGTDWAKLPVTTAVGRGLNQAVMYDTTQKELVVFGGAFAFTTTAQSTTYFYKPEANDFFVLDDTTSPSPRSLFSMVTDPVNNTVWLLGGISDNQVVSDFWKFEDGLWQKVEVEGTPTCASPVASFDTDRARLVAVCPDSATYEWDGTAWKSFTDLKNKPPIHRFSSMVYDQNVKKTIFYGGYDEKGGYFDKTWAWDGAAWTEVAKKKKAPARSLAAMWYDSKLHKTVVYGGIGRRSFNGRIERYSDMWAFDGSNWTELKPSTRPSARFGAHVAVDPRTNVTILYGGMVVETVDEKKNLQKQTYGQDTWEWDGTNWRRIETPASAGPRENGGMAFDPEGQWIILNGGWSGYFHSDTWRFEDGTWVPFAEKPLGAEPPPASKRRRAVAGM